MDKFTNWERQGLWDLFSSPAARDTVIPVAKIISKNMLNPKTNTGCDCVGIIIESNEIEFVSLNIFRGCQYDTVAFNNYTEHSQSEGHYQREFIQIFA